MSAPAANSEQRELAAARQAVADAKLELAAAQARLDQLQAAQVIPRQTALSV